MAQQANDDCPISPSSDYLRARKHRDTVGGKYSVRSMRAARSCGGPNVLWFRQAVILTPDSHFAARRLVCVLLFRSPSTKRPDVTTVWPSWVGNLRQRPSVAYRIQSYGIQRVLAGPVAKSKEDRSAPDFRLHLLACTTSFRACMLAGLLIGAGTVALPCAANGEPSRL